MFSHIPRNLNLAILYENGYSPLHLAAAAGFSHMLNETLNQNNFYANAYDDDGKTPLHYAAQNRTIERVKSLLAVKNIEINAKDNSGFTPLNLAYRSHNSQNKQICKLLISHGGIFVDYSSHVTDLY